MSWYPSYVNNLIWHILLRVPVDLRELEMPMRDLADQRITSALMRLRRLEHLQLVVGELESLVPAPFFRLLTAIGAQMCTLEIHSGRGTVILTSHDLKQLHLRGCSDCPRGSGSTGLTHQC
jgi:hypothetical protein